MSVQLERLSSTEVIEFGLQKSYLANETAHQDIRHLRGIPALNVQYKEDVCIPQTPLHKELQQEYELVTFQQVNIEKAAAVCYLHRDDYDYLVTELIE